MTTANFFVAELTAFRQGANTVSVGQGHGAHPHGALAELADQIVTTSTLYASDLGYRTLSTDPLPTNPYPPLIDKAFQMSRALNLDPAQSAAGAGWGMLALNNAGGLYNAIAGSWNSDGRALKLLRGTKTLEDTPGPLTARSTTATYFGSDFLLHTAAARVVRYDYMVPGRVRNPAVLNAVAGTPGTAPTFWTSNAATGISTQIVGTGTENGIPYLDVRFFGTPSTGSAFMNVAFEGNQYVAALQGQQWTGSYSVRQSGGSTANVSGFRTVIQEVNSAGTLTANDVSGTVALPSVLSKIVYTATLSGSGTANAKHYFQMLATLASVPVDITVRIGGPAFDPGAVPSTIVYPPTVLNELAATNLMLSSAAIGASPWALANVTAGLNSIAAPDGTNTATLIAETTATGQHYVWGNAGTVAVGDVVTFSVYLKANGSTVAALTANGEGQANFTLGGPGSATHGGTCTAATIVLVGPATGWYRCTATFTKSNTTPAFYINPNNNFGSYAGSTSNSIYAWGAQVEKAAVASSYIPTTAATVTRAGDFLYLPRMTYQDPPYASLASYFTGMATQWTLTETELQVPIRDATYWIERPLQNTLYLGTGGYESPIPYTGAPPPPPNSTSLLGMTKPKARGGTSNYPIRNVSPVLVDPVNLIYQYSDAAGTVVALYEGGAAVFAFQADVADLYVGTTTAGNYRTSNARGMFQLGSSPVQAITCDVTGAFPDGTTATNLGVLAYNLLKQDLTVPVANLNAASFTAFDTAHAWTAGIFFASEGTVYVPDAAPTAKSTDGVAAMTQLLAGCGAQLYPARDGTLRMFLLAAVPFGTSPVASFDITTVVSVTSKPLPANLNPPPFRMRVGYQHNYTVQQQAALSPSINLNALQFVQAQDRYAAASSNTILLAFNRPNDPAPVPTSLLSPINAQTAANSLIGLWGARRRLYDVVVPFAVGVLREIGDVVRLTWPMDDLIQGQLGQIVGEQFNSTDPTITLSVLI